MRKEYKTPQATRCEFRMGDIMQMPGGWGGNLTGSPIS